MKKISDMGPVVYYLVAGAMISFIGFLGLVGGATTAGIIFLIFGLVVIAIVLIVNYATNKQINKELAARQIKQKNADDDFVKRLVDGNEQVLKKYPGLAYFEERYGMGFWPFFNAYKQAYSRAERVKTNTGSHNYIYVTPVYESFVLSEYPGSASEYPSFANINDLNYKVNSELFEKHIYEKDDISYIKIEEKVTESSSKDDVIDSAITEALLGTAAAINSATKKTQTLEAYATVYLKKKFGEVSSFSVINSGQQYALGLYAFFKDMAVFKTYEAYQAEIMEARKEEKHIATPINSSDKFHEIEKFKELFDKGIISKEEFEQKKKELLGL